MNGIAVSPGIVAGKAFLVGKEELSLSQRMITVREIQQEKDKVNAGIADAQGQIDRLRQRLDEQDEMMLDMLDIQWELLEDPVFLKKIHHYIDISLNEAADAVLRATQEMAAMFAAMDNEYMRARAADITDVGERLARAISGKVGRDFSAVEEDVIFFAEDLSPSDTIAMDKRHLLGFVTRQGSQTSHTAILARMLEIPAVVGCDYTGVRHGDFVIVDGCTGTVLVSPDAKTIQDYECRAQVFCSNRDKLKALKELPAVTIDGKALQVWGNISDPVDVSKVLENGGEGVGLFRTEFIYMNRQSLPDEESQFLIYKEAAIRAQGRPVIIRTLDIGGDKELAYLDLPKEENPFLGYRAIRICLDNPDIFKTQLRALLRASAFGEIRIMFPMICTMSELRRAKALLEECKEELRTEGKAFNEAIQRGMMVEVPAVAAAADLFAKEVDFFSIGTNDLCQYTLAVDRMNPKVAGLCNPFNIGVLRLIAGTIRAAREASIAVGMCGEMAGDVNATLLLLGLGLDEFSVSPAFIPYIKDIIRNSNSAQAADVAQKALSMTSAIDIKHFLEEVTHG